MNKKQRLYTECGAKTAKAYETWVGMRRRIRSPRPEKGETNYSNVAICEQWNRFEVFLSDMGLPELDESIDRIDSTGDYKPENCRWATAVTQSRNRRCIKLDEKKVEQIRSLESAATQTEIASMFGVSQAMVSSVLRNKSWSQLGAIK